MRLINVETLELCEVQNSALSQPYVILSHSWEDDEVTFQEFSAKTCRRKAGYQKIVRCCEQAKFDGFQYVWADTCCIDKTSSSELSEAINSMFQWYKQARVCYVYMSDVRRADQATLRDFQNNGYMNIRHPVNGPHGQLFEDSRWFTRGWTLQELIAPSHVVIYDCDWVEIGTKDSMQDDISNITGIPPAVLADVNAMRRYPTAQRMSWAAFRQTTRQEDIAYCLMGIFDVNMPILYGEGDKAFVRLQHEIMKGSVDQTIFAWVGYSPRDGEIQSTAAKSRIRKLGDSPDTLSEMRQCLQVPGDAVSYPSSDEYRMSSVFARHPFAFRCGRYINRIGATPSPFSITNKGLHISLPLVLTNQKMQGTFIAGDGRVFFGIIDCSFYDYGTGESTKLGIFLAQHSPDYYTRIYAELLCPASRVLKLMGDPGNSTGYRVPSPSNLYIGASASLAWRDNWTTSDTHTPKIEATLLLFNCTLTRFDERKAVIDLLKAVPTGVLRIFAFRIKTNHPDADQAIVVLLVGSPGPPKLSCAVYLPSDSQSSNQEFENWLEQHTRKPHGHRVTTNRAIRHLPRGDELVVAVNPNPRSLLSYSVTVRCLNSVVSQPDPGQVKRVPKTQWHQMFNQRDYEGNRRDYKHEWCGGIILSTYNFSKIRR